MFGSNSQHFRYVLYDHDNLSVVMTTFRYVLVRLSAYGHIPSAMMPVLDHSHNPLLVHKWYLIHFNKGWARMLLKWKHFLTVIQIHFTLSNQSHITNPYLQINTRQSSSSSLWYHHYQQEADTSPNVVLSSSCRQKSLLLVSCHSSWILVSSVSFTSRVRLHAGKPLPREV